jgi:hypothetical protein
MMEERRVKQDFLMSSVGINIDLNIGDIRHRHLLFWYRKKICRMENCHSNIERVPISTSGCIPLSNIKIIYHWWAQSWSVRNRMSDILYWIKVYSDVRYNAGLCSFLSDIRGFHIRLSLISLFGDIEQSAHICFRFLLVAYNIYIHISVLEN